MQCRSCGTEIADKAIVCYRCGAGTTDPVRSPVPVRARRAGGPPLVAAVIPLLLALVLLFMGHSSTHAEALTLGAEASGATGVLLLIARLLRRR
jgi:hypothetical protein